MHSGNILSFLYISPASSAVRPDWGTGRNLLTLAALSASEAPTFGTSDPLSLWQVIKS